ncbi:MAG: hypothetical protein V3573_06140 [Desulfovibrionaceae bacterium]
MSSPIDYPTLISQLPFVSKLATAEQTHPEVRQELFGPLLLKKQKEEQERVQEIEKKEKTEMVTRDGKNPSGGQQQGERQKREEADPEEQAMASNASPWSGNIVNRRI